MTDTDLLRSEELRAEYWKDRALKAEARLEQVQAAAYVRMTPAGPVRLEYPPNQGATHGRVMP